MARRLRLGSILLAACLALTGAAAGETLQEQQRDLELLQQKMEAIGRSLERKESAERSLLGDLEELEARSRELARRRQRLERELEESRRELAAEEKRAEGLRREAAQREELVGHRLGAIYRGSGDEAWQIVFSRSPPARKAEDLYYLQRIVRRDRELLEDYRRQLQRLEESLARVAALERNQQERLRTLEQNRAALKQAEGLKKKLVERARRDRERLAGELEEMRRREGELLELIKKLETEKVQEYIEKSGTFTDRKGSLPWPAEGPLRTEFGPWKHPELGTLHESQGIEIEVAPETEIRAVAAGRVVFASPFKGYGQLLIVNHGSGYFTLYARSERLLKSVGQEVAAGEPLAVAGSAPPGAVYFEIRHHRTPLDPLAWLGKTLSGRKD